MCLENGEIGRWREVGPRNSPPASVAHMAKVQANEKPCLRQQWNDT